MKARITMLTLRVDDLKRSLAFYRDGLGLPTAGIVGAEFEHGTVAFYATAHATIATSSPSTESTR